MRNPFGVLGLEASADADQVRAAYRKLVKTCHPDKFQDETERKAAQEKMITLNLAYEEAMKLAVNRTTASAAFNRELDQQDALTLAAKMLRQDNPEAALRQLLRASTRDSAWYAMQGKVLMALEQYESAHQSYREAIRRLVISGVRFDFAFLDAPYASGFAVDAARLLFSEGLMQPQGLVLIEHSSSYAPPDDVPGVMRRRRTRKFGACAVSEMERDEAT